MKKEEAMNGIINGTANGIIHNIEYDVMKGREQFLIDQFVKTIGENKTAMFRLAYSMVLNREDAEDIVSETIVKAYSHLDELKNIRKMKAWIFQILVNESKTYLKKRNRIDLIEDISIFEEKEKDEKENYDLLEFVCQLEDIFKEVIILYYFEEFRVKEIADILNISEGTVKSRLSRARVKLKGFLENNDNWKGWI